MDIEIPQVTFKIDVTELLEWVTDQDEVERYFSMPDYFDKDEDNDDLWVDPDGTMWFTERQYRQGNAELSELFHDYLCENYDGDLPSEFSAKLCDYRRTVTKSKGSGVNSHNVFEIVYESDQTILQNQTEMDEALVSARTSGANNVHRHLISLIEQNLNSGSDQLAEIYQFITEQGFTVPDIDDGVTFDEAGAELPGGAEITQ